MVAEASEKRRSSSLAEALEKRRSSASDDTANLSFARSNCPHRHSKQTSASEDTANSPTAQDDARVRAYPCPSP